MTTTTICRRDTLLVQVAPARTAPNGTAAAAFLGIGAVLLWRRIASVATAASR